MKFSSPRAIFAAMLSLFALAGCDTATAPQSPEASGSAATQTYSGSGRKITCPGKSGGVCDMDVSVVMDGEGSATLIVRTGGYDQATGDHDPNGTFEKIQYKIFNEKGKLVSTKNSEASGTIFRTRLAGEFATGFRVEVQANIRNHSGKKGTAVVRGVGNATYLPDIDLSAETIELVVGGARMPLKPVVPGTSNTYVVDIANLTTLGGTPSTTGILVKCVVLVDGVPQVPFVTPGFSYVSGALQYLGPGQTGPCSFNLSLAEGTHTITVTAVAADLFADSRPANNSTSAQVVAQNAPAASPDLSVTRLERVVAGGSPVPLGDVLAGDTHTFKAWVTSPVGSATANATCSVTVNGQPPASIQWTTQSVTVQGGATTECVFALPMATPGSYAIAATATSVGDPNAANNTLVGTLMVRPAVSTEITTDLVVRDLGPSTPIFSGTEQEYVARIGVNPGGSLSGPEFTCSVAATRLSGQPASVNVLWSKQTGTASETTNDECRFRITGMTATGALDDTYRIVVTATATNANELPGKSADNSRTIDQSVRAITIDLDILRLERYTGSAWTTVDSALAGPTYTYRAFIGTVAGAALTTGDFTCSAEVSAPGVTTQTIPGTASGPATTAGIATCTFPLALQGDGNEDRAYTINVSATPTVGTESNPGNNVQPFTQNAMVRADVGVLVDRIQLSVNNLLHPCTAVSGLCSLLKTDTISVGETGNFTAYLRNYSSDRTANVMCEVWTNPPGSPAVQIAAIPAQVQIIPGAEVSCAFTHLFAERVAAEFMVIAKAISPKDNQTSNDTVRFTMAPVQNIIFPNLQFANVTLSEYGAISNNVVTDVYNQQANISRVFLAFTNKTEVIGDFTFTGKAYSNGSATPFSQAVFKVTGLRPGGLGTQRNCVTLGGPGAAVLSQATVNDHYVLPEVCAEQSAADETIQMISVTYNTIMDGTHSGPGVFNFGPTVTFELFLEWVLAGNLPSQVSTARGKLQFDVNFRPASSGNTYNKDQTGTVTILPP